MNKTTSIATIALTALFGLTACSTAGEPAAPVPEESATAAPAAATEPASDATEGTAKFGKTWIYDSGIEVTVKQAGGAEASEYAAGVEETGGHYGLYEVTIANGTDEILDPSMTNVEVNYGDSGSPASRVFDEGLDDFFQGKVLPGKSQTITEGYAIPAGEDVIMSVTPDFSHDDAIFVGTAE